MRSTTPENTPDEVRRLEEIADELEAIQRTRRETGIENENHSRRAMQLAVERIEIKRAPYLRREWEHRAQTDPAYNIQLVPPPPPAPRRKSDAELTLPEWLDRYAHQYQAVSTRAAGWIAGYDPNCITDEEKAFLLEYGQKQRSLKTGAWKLEQDRRNMQQEQAERQAERAVIHNAIAADHAEGKALLHQQFERQLGRDQD